MLARANLALDATNFFLADVRDALGPYLAVYLLTERQWDAASIGVVMSVATIAGIVAQTPAGALVDVTRAKRAVMAAAAIVVTAASLLIPWLSSFWLVAASQAAAHAAGVVFGPALAAVTLGIFGHRAFTKRIGRNESFNHAGNAFAAATAGALAYLWGPKIVFYLLASMAMASIVSVLAIPMRAIDHDLARGLHDARSANSTTTGRPSAVRLAGATDLPPAAYLRRLRDHVSLRQRGDAAARRPKARASRQEFGNNAHVGVYRRRTSRDGADGHAGRC
jgi:MFS family permease